MAEIKGYIFSRTEYSNIWIGRRTPSDIPPYIFISCKESKIRLADNEFDSIKYISPAFIHFFMDLERWEFNLDQLEYTDPMRPPEKIGGKPILYLERLMFYCEFVGRFKPTSYQLSVLRKDYNIIK